MTECPVDRCEWGRDGVCFWRLQNCPHRHEVEEHVQKRRERAALVEAARQRMAEKCKNAERMAHKRTAGKAEP